VIYRVLPVAAIVLILLLFQGPINRMFDSGSDKTPAKVVAIDLPKEEASPQASVESGDKSSATEAASASAPESALKYPKPASMEPPIALQVPPEEDAAQGQIFATDVDSEQSVPSQSVETSQNITVEGPGVQEEKPELVLTEASQAEKVEAPVPPTPEAEEAQVAPEIPKPDEPSVEKTTAVAPAAVVDSGGEGLSLVDGKVWVASQPPGNYTLQLLAAGNLVSVQRFIKKHGLSGEVFTIQTQRKGKPWYPLLWGSFADRDAAKIASKQLPSAIQSAGYWARTFASLQN
jgi:DamX protein